MGMVAARRVLWCVVVGGWPAVAAVRTEFHPAWGPWLTLGGAAAEPACALILRAGLAATRGRLSRARETERRLAELERLVSAMGDALAAAARHAGAPYPGPRHLRSVAPGKEPG